MQATEWNKIFEVLREKTKHQPRVLYPMSLFFKSENITGLSQTKIISCQ